MRLVVAAAPVTTALILFLFVSTATSLNFNLTAFSASVINCYGNATLSSNGIDLTVNQVNENLNFSTGRAVYYEPLHLWDNLTGQAAHFTTHFTFTISNPTESFPADGFAFFLAPFPANLIPNNSGGGRLGLFNFSAPQVVAVEFDTFHNYYDPSSNHMGIDINSILSTNYVSLDNASLITTSPGYATVSYDPANMTLSAWLSYPHNQTLAGVSWNVSYAVDLRYYLPEQVAIGFSGATGAGLELHTIKSWDFNSTELPKIIAATPAKQNGVNRWILQVVVNVVVLIGLSFMLCLLRYCWKRRNRMADYAQTDQELLNFDGILNQSGRAPKRFEYDELVTATRNFSIDEKLGQGGFGAVFRGVLVKMNGMQVAIKRISKGSMQGMKEYMAEVTIISQLRHRHLVQLIGYCHDKGEFLLVYEYMPNKSLDAHLYNKHTLLGSKDRYKIALDIASALTYLHEGWEHGVVHRDIKPSNIMLDTNFNAKLGDFGMAKLVEHDQSLLSTVLAGTRGYMAPEYIETGKAGKECDVFSFGILAMELACGRRPIDHSEKEEARVRLVDWVQELYDQKKCSEAIDKRLNKEIDNGRLEHLMVVGLWCAHPDNKLRPTIGHAFCVLKFDAMLPEVPPPLLRKGYSLPTAASCSSSESKVLPQVPTRTSRKGYSLPNVGSSSSESEVLVFSV